MLKRSKQVFDIIFNTRFKNIKSSILTSKADGNHDIGSQRAAKWKTPSAFLALIKNVRLNITDFKNLNSRVF